MSAIDQIREALAAASDYSSAYSIALKASHGHQMPKKQESALQEALRFNEAIAAFEALLAEHAALQAEVSELRAEVERLQSIVSHVK